MRLELLWKPGLMCERLGYGARQRRRLKSLRGTVAEGLEVGHIDSLELLLAARPLGVRSIYDVGANVGTWSLLAKAVIPEASIEAFEPIPNHQTRFEKALEGISDVTLHRIALGAARTCAALRVTDFADASSMLPLAAAGRAEFGVQEVEQLSVELRRLDDYRRDCGFKFPDLMKLDVQGYELEVLKGATECLLNAKAVIIEVSFVEYYERQCLFHEVVAFLARSGLLPAAFGEPTPAGGPLNQSDVLFRRPEARCA